MGSKKRGVEPVSVTIEEVVARAINLDYSPDNVSIEEVVEAIEIDASNEAIDKTTTTEREEQVGPKTIVIHLSSEDDEEAEIRESVTKARADLARSLHRAIDHELNKADSKIKLTNEKSPKHRIDMKSANQWLADQFGIGLQEWAPIDPRRRKEMKDHEREKLLRTIALFATEVAENHKCISPTEGIDTGALASLMAEKNYEGFSERTLRTVISNSKDAIVDFPFVKSK